MDRENEATIADEQASQSYLGQWNRLISTTNWEKGRIIHEWRAALMESGTAATDYSDENWSRMVGGVTGQHTGRLRRVFERFGDVYRQYDGLFWSHFQASLDWEDAEMWLEGSIQNHWSVSAMRRERWETMGAVVGEEPRVEDILAVEVDEDFSDDDDAGGDRSPDSEQRAADGMPAEARSPAGPDFGDEHDVPPRDTETGDADYEAASGDEARDDSVRPFADLAELPEDLTTAFEAFQLAILRHKSQQWQEISLDDVLASLDALKAMALAPAQ